MDACGSKQCVTRSYGFAISENKFAFKIIRKVILSDAMAGKGWNTANAWDADAEWYGWGAAAADDC